MTFRTVGGSTGRGRLITQSMFGIDGVRKATTVNNSGLASVADNYVFGKKPILINPNWPLIGTSVAFDADPFDVFPYNVPFGTTQSVNTQYQTYIDISDRVQGVDTSAGKQYELDLISSGEGTMVLLDKEEHLNPANTMSPFYPNVKVYRPIFDGAMWPPVPVGGSVNLFNLTYGFDPTFNSYPVNTTPPFVRYWTSLAAPLLQNISGQNWIQTFLSSGGIARQGFTVDVPCIPGQVYTTELFTSTSIATPICIQMYDGEARGTTVNDATAGVTLVITFTATKPIQTLMITTTRTPPSCVMYAVNLQHECGAVVHPFSTTGPVIYGLFGGFVERWPANWNYHGTYGMAQITVVDALTLFSQWEFAAEYVQSVKSKNPDLYWRMNDAGTTFAETSGNNGPPLIQNQSKTGGGTLAAQTSITIAGDQSAQGVSLTGSTIPGLTVSTGIGLQAGIKGNGSLGLGGTGTSWTITAAWWMTFPGAGTTSFNSFDIITLGGSSGLRETQGGPVIRVAYRNDTLFLEVSYNNGTFDTSAAFVHDGLSHVMYLTAQLSGGNVSLFLYKDDVVVTSFSINALSSWGTSTPAFIINSVQVGGTFDPSTSSAGYAAIYAHLSIWKRALSAAELSDLHNAGTFGYAGERTDQRIARYLGYQPFAITNLDVGATTLGVSDLADGTAVLDALQDVTTSENGNFLPDPYGTLTFQSRTHRYLETTARFVFGENQANSEVPYTDDITFDFDPTQIYNDVTVTQVNGIVAEAINSDSVDEYGTRTLSIQTNTASSLEAVDYSNFVSNGHAQPVQRVEQITISPGTNPALWSLALGARFGDRVTVIRRTPVFTMSADYFIERIERSRDETMIFTVVFQLSPASAFRQPWILQDPVFGVLDSTTVLGF